MNFLRIESSGQGDSTQVGTATAEGRHFPCLWAHALESGHDHHAAIGDAVADAVTEDFMDARVAVRFVGQNPALRAGEGNRVMAALLQSDAEQSHADPFPG